VSEGKNTAPGVIVDPSMNLYFLVPPSSSKTSAAENKSLILKELPGFASGVVVNPTALS
jgi:hypothetical protein